MTGRVWVVGSINLDLRMPVARIPDPGETVSTSGAVGWWPGGKGANQAVAAHRAGVPVTLVAATGDDELGRAYRERLDALGLDARIDVRPGVPTGTAVLLVEDDGENSIVVAPGANAELHPPHLEAALADLTADDVLLVQLEIAELPVLTALRLAADRGVRILVNPSPRRPLPRELVELTDTFIVNEGEALTFADRPDVDLCRTLGAAGARWGALSARPSVSVDVVDTTGAGDAFAGTLAAALVGRRTAAEALQLAVDAGARACAYPGAQGWSFG